MRTSLKRLLMPAAIGATAIAWITRVLSGRLVADQGDRERFYENYSDAGRRWKRSKLSHGASISPTTLHGLTSKMAATTAKFNQALFMEEVQRYECIYDKFSKDYKNKYIRLNSWKAIGEKFGLDAPEAERRYKNCRTSYGRYLKKRKSVPSGSGRNAVPTPAEFANLEWLNNHINHRAETVTNVAAVPSDSEEEGGDVVLDEANVDEQERPSELVSEDVANSDNDSRASTTNTSSSTGGNSQENPNNKSNKYKQKTTGLRKLKRKSTTKEDVDLALLKTASTLADKVMNAESTPKRREADEEDDEDLLYCKSLARRLKTMPAPTKAFVRLQIEQLLYDTQYNQQQQAFPSQQISVFSMENRSGHQLHQL